MKKQTFLKCFFSLIILISIVNCIFEIISIAKKLTIYNDLNSYSPPSMSIKYSFEIILNILFIAIIAFIAIISFYKKCSLKTKLSKIVVVFTLVIISCLFIYKIVDICYQTQTIGYQIEAYKGMMESGNSMSDMFKEIISKYEVVKSSLFPLFITNSLMYASVICGIIIWIFIERKQNRHLTLPVDAE